MKHFARIAALMTTLLVAAVAAAPASAANPVQLSLGDSWGFGFGAAVPSEGGYVPQLHTALQQDFDCSPSDNPKPDQGCKNLELINLSVGGATTPTLIANQLPGAVEILEARNGNQNPRDNVEVVTLHIGGNDVTNPIIAACILGLSPNCLNVINTEFAAYRSDLDTALSALRAAAGDGRILMGTYDNPIPTCALGGITGASQLAVLVLEGGPGLDGLHDVMRDVAADHGVEVVNVFGQLGPQDWVGGQDCLHPDDSGYEKVAAAFHAALN
ncbi:MAG: SGNH/GDSL hydrolase family protein [Solirubrobacterales bacterium]